MADADLSAKQPQGDHRARAGHTKRVRTRSQILEAVLVAYPGDDPNRQPVVEDVVREAKVSRATFYKYFASLEEAVEELGAQFSGELAGVRAAIYSDILDPKIRVATGFQLFLSRAVIDPDWAKFITHADRLARDQDLISQMKRDLEGGVSSHDFKIEDLDVALNLIVSAKVAAMRQLRKSEGARRYIEMLTTMILQSLGVPPKSAAGASRQASIQLHAEGPKRLSWWQAFD